MYRNLAISVSTVLVFAGMAVGVGCDEPEEDAQQQDDEQAAAEPDSERAGEVLGILADGAHAYMEGDQEWSTVDGPEPWNDSRAADETPGNSLAYNDKVFPGGTNVRVEFAPQVPEGGELVETDPELVEHDADSDVLDATLAMLNRPMDDEEPFRYVYETGPETGAEATATIRAEANLDPDPPEHHTVIKELGIDVDEGRATVSDSIVENEGH